MVHSRNIEDVWRIVCQRYDLEFACVYANNDGGPVWADDHIVKIFGLSWPAFSETDGLTAWE